MFVGALDKDLSSRGWNNDGKPETFHMGRTMGGRILLGD